MMATNGRKGAAGVVLNQKGGVGNGIKTSAAGSASSDANALSDLANWAMKYKPMMGAINNHSEPPSLHGTSPDAPSHGSDEVHQKPPCSYACLITWAIRDSEGHRIKLEGIYAWIMDRYPYFKDEGARNMRHAGWKNSVRHNLSINPCFAKGPNRSGDAKGKGGYWTIAKGFEDQATSHTLKKTSSKRSAKKGRGRNAKATTAGAASATAGDDASSTTTSAASSPAPAPIKEEKASSSSSSSDKPGQPDWAGNAAAAALAALSPRSSRPSSRVGSGGTPTSWKSLAGSVGSNSSSGSNNSAGGIGPPPAVPLQQQQQQEQQQKQKQKQAGRVGPGAARSLSTSSTASSESVPCSMCFTRCHFVDTSGGHCKSAQASGASGNGAAAAATAASGVGGGGGGGTPAPATAPTLGGAWGSSSPVRLVSKPIVAINRTSSTNGRSSEVISDGSNGSNNSDEDDSTQPLYVQAVRIAGGQSGGVGVGITAAAPARAAVKSTNEGGGGSRKRQRESATIATATPAVSAAAAASAAVDAVVAAPAKRVKIGDVDSATATYVMAKQAAAIERLKALARRAGVETSEIEKAAKVL